jgi:hypothetical protein
MTKSLSFFGWASLLLAASVFLAADAGAQNTYYVKAGGAGTKDGSSWANAYSDLPGTLVRGATYYMASGTYGRLNFNTPASGSSWVYIKKATASDHGPDNTTWVASYATGQAVFGSGMYITTPYLSVDGQTGGGPGSWTSGHGIKVVYTGNTAVVEMPSGHDFIFRHMEVVGDGDSSVTVGSNTNDGFSVYDHGLNLTVSYCWIYNCGRCCFTPFGDNVTIEYSCTGFYHADVSHSEVVSIANSQAGMAVYSNFIFRNNLVTFVSGTGGLVMQVNGAQIYGNVFYAPSSTYPANGTITCWSPSGGVSYQNHNHQIYNNTFYSDPQHTAIAYYGSDLQNIVAYNNVFYNLAGGAGFYGTTTHDYNHFINSSPGSSSETHGSSSTGDPCVNSAGMNFSLTANTPAGMNLGAPYNVDPTGAARTTWSRGAYEYGGVSTNPIISLSQSSLSFGSATVGTTNLLTITVQNVGAGTLAGTASVAAPFRIVSGSPYSLGPNQSQTVTISFIPVAAGTTNGTASFTGGGNATATISGTGVASLSGSLSFPATAGAVSGGFTITNNYIYQATDTSGTMSGGRATYNFTITNAGNYAIQAVVNAPSLTENSFYVNIDADPQDPTMAWDIMPITTGFQTEFVGWRGTTGTSEGDQYAPKIFTLSAGSHQLVIIGREANAQLQSLAILPVPAAPKNLRLASVP